MGEVFYALDQSPLRFHFKNRNENGGKKNENDYKRNYFWIRPDEYGNRKYYFNIKGDFIEVEKDVFNVCYNSYKKQLRDQKKDNNVALVNLEDMNKDGIELIDFVGIDTDYVTDLYNQERITQIMKCIINELDEKDKVLITHLLIKEKTERELAELNNVTQPAIHKRKNLIIKKMREKLKNNF